MSPQNDVPQKPPGAPPVELLSSDQVIAQLAEHLAPDAMLAFDADGTLWSGDIGVETFHALLAAGGVRGEAAPALREEARGHGVTLTDDPSEQARLLDAARLEGKYPEDRAFAMMAWAFAGYTLGELRAFASRVIDDVALASRLHPEVLPILRWASQQAVPLYVVSASPAEVITIALARLDLPVAAVLGMSPVLIDGKVAPRCRPPLTYGPGKTAALHAAANDKRLIGAFGDSVYDFPMLSAAAVPVMVRPKAELVHRAHHDAPSRFFELRPAPLAGPGALRTEPRAP